MKGFFLIDKESGVTSFDVVRDIRRLTGVKKVGHSGTLDPLATGLLLVAVGEGTKLLEFLIGCTKEYEVLGRFGFKSDTYDAEGSIDKVSSKVLSSEEIEAAIKANFLGNIEQIPPKYSALKIKGKRAADIMREGGDVEMKARKLHISNFEILEFDWPVVKFRVACSSGTYIRSLIHDLGELLETGAYVEELRRSKIGDFSLSDAAKINLLSKNIEQNLISMEDLAKSFNICELSGADYEGLKDGKVLLGKNIEQEVPVMAFYKDKLVGVLEYKEGGVKYKKMIF